MSANWAGLTPEVAQDHWPEIESILEPAMRKNRSDFRPEDILLGVKEKRYQLWVVFDDRIRAVVVTEILKFPVRKVCFVLVLAGRDLNEWIHLLEAVLMPWSKAEGCVKIRGLPRKGLGPILSARGWKTTRLVMERDL